MDLKQLGYFPLTFSCKFRLLSELGRVYYTSHKLALEKIVIEHTDNDDNN